MILINSAVILATINIVFCEETFPLSRLTDPIRLCQPHIPLPVNISRDPTSCDRELASATKLNDPEADKNIAQIATENGFSLEAHNATTSDGYILTTFRIPGGPKSEARKGKPAVLLLHGLGGSSESWIALPNDKNLAFMLANAGWDVWLANNRGSTFSNKHITLNPDFDLNYWEFSFHEMGIYDLPTIVDQIRAETEHQKIFVIGHSQGSTLFLVGASEVPDLNDKIHAAYLMAPAAFLGGAYEPFLTSVLPLLITPFENFLFTVFAGRIQRKNTRLMALLSSFQLHDICQPRILRCGLCGTVFGTNTFNPTQMNYTNIPRMVSKLFNVENFRSSIHFGQQIRSCGFRYYDHGPAGNLKRYGTQIPPNYKLERVTAPLHLLWAEQDSIVTPTDVQKLAESLSPQTLKSVTRVNDDTFDHTDFSVARDANILVYEPLIAKMTKAWEEIVGGSSTR